MQGACRRWTRFCHGLRDGECFVCIVLPIGLNEGGDVRKVCTDSRVEDFLKLLHHTFSSDITARC